MLFSATVWHLSGRDQWIGWDKKDREKRLNLVINHNRFLIFPWVKIPNLASKALALVTRQIRNDWQDEANKNTRSGAVKSIWVIPLQNHFRAMLKNQHPAKAAVDLDDSFVKLWGKIEEPYKISKNMIEVDDFHGRSERTVKQELFAHFVLITMTRFCSNESENLVNSLLNLQPDERDPKQTIQANFKNSLAPLSRPLEEIMFTPVSCIKKMRDDIISAISRNHQKVRPGRSYVRKSKKLVNKVARA